MHLKGYEHALLSTSILFIAVIKQCMQLSSAVAWHDVLHMHKAGECMLSKAAMRHQLMGCTLGSLLLHVAQFCSIVCTRYRGMTYRACICNARKPIPSYIVCLLQII